MLDIVKRIAVGVAIGMSIFFLKGIVAHAEVDFEFKDEKALWNANKSDYVALSSTSTGGGFHQVANIYFDTQYTNTEGYKYAVFYGTWVFYNNTNASFNYDLRLLTVQMNALSGTGKASNCFFDGGTRLICPITKNATYTKISIYLPYNMMLYGQGYNNSSTQADFWFNYTFIRFVQFGNDQLSSGEQAINDSITDDTDHSGNGTSYDNSGVTSNTTKEDTLTQNAEQNINSFDIDFSTISSGFQYLLGLFSNICQANIKLFGMILSLLGFGFIGLVLGR